MKKKTIGILLLLSSAVGILLAIAFTIQAGFYADASGTVGGVPGSAWAAVGGAVVAAILGFVLLRNRRRRAQVTPARPR